MAGQEMMVKGSVEDYIYILIGIIWIAFSIYKGFKGNQNKKTKPENIDDQYDGESGEAEPTKVRKSVFDSFLQEIIGEDETVPYAPIEVDEEKKTSPQQMEEARSTLFSYDDFYEESNHQEKTDVYDEERAATKPTEQKELRTYLQRRKKPRIDLKKAVIYSEILNRRYF